MSVIFLIYSLFVFFFNDTATTEIYTLSLHDALPISCAALTREISDVSATLLTMSALIMVASEGADYTKVTWNRSEEHTSELQSQSNLVCRLLLEKKKKNRRIKIIIITVIHRALICVD